MFLTHHSNTTTTFMTFTKELVLKGSRMAIAPMLYVGYALYQLTPDERSQVNFNIPLFFLSLPLVYGLVFAVLRQFIPNMAILGMVAGFIYSLLGRFLLKMPKQIFKSIEPSTVHITAMVLYAGLYTLFFSSE